MIPRIGIAVNAALFAFVAWLYGGDLLEAAQAASNEVAALAAPPSVPFAAVALGLALAGGGLTAFGALKKRDREWRGYRVMPIVAVVVVFVDLFMISAAKSPFPSYARAASALELLERRLNELSTERAVPTDERTLQELARELGSPPWLLHGAPIAEWSVSVTNACTGPRLEAPGHRAGTILYCIDASASHAWITLVGLPSGTRFGASQVISDLKGEVGLKAKEEEPPEASPPFTVDADAGTLSPP
jgi:hypothetical protein